MAEIINQKFSFKRVITTVGIVVGLFSVVLAISLFIILKLEERDMKKFASESQVR